MTTTSTESENDKMAKVADIVRTDFANYYEGYFDVIPDQTVNEWTDEDGGYVRVFIVFDGKAKDIPMRWSRGVMGRVRKRLYEADISDLPILAPVSRSEWKRAAKHRRNMA